MSRWSILLSLVVVFLALLFIYVQGLSLPTNGASEVDGLQKGICKEETLETLHKSASNLGRSLFFFDTDEKVSLNRLVAGNESVLSKALNSNEWFFTSDVERTYFGRFVVRHTYALYFDEDCISSIWVKRYFLQK